MTDHYLWESLAIFIPIVLGAYISLQIQRRLKKEDKVEIIKGIKEAIKKELQENNEAIEEEDTTATKTGNITKNAMLFLENASYESTINSGNFILLPSELRKTISEVYAYIRIANIHVDQFIKSQFTLTTDETKDKLESIIKLQAERLAEAHKKIVKLSKELIKKL